MDQGQQPPLSEQDRQILERIKGWIDTDVAHALARSGQLKIEVNVKGQDIRANVSGFYQLD